MIVICYVHRRICYASTPHNFLRRFSEINRFVFAAFVVLVFLLLVAGAM